MLTNILGVVLLLAAALFLLGVIVVIRPLPRFNLSKRRYGLALMVSTFFGMTIIGFFLPNTPQAKPATDGLAAPSPAVAPTPQLPTLASLKAVDPAITAVEVDGPQLVVKADIKDGLDLPSYVDLAGMAARSIGQGLQRGVRDSLQGVGSVEFTFRAAAQDRLGRESMAPFMTLSLSLADLKAANYDNLHGPGVLNLTDHVMITGQDGVAAIAAWCAKPDNLGAHFCAVALPK